MSKNRDEHAQKILLELQTFSSFLSLSDMVRRQVAAADHEEARLRDLAGQSGGMRGEVDIVWRFSRRHGGLWPSLN